MLKVRYLSGNNDWVDGLAGKLNPTSIAELIVYFDDGSQDSMQIKDLQFLVDNIWMTFDEAHKRGLLNLDTVNDNVVLAENLVESYNFYFDDIKGTKFVKEYNTKMKPLRDVLESHIFDENITVAENIRLIKAHNEKARKSRDIVYEDNQRLLKLRKFDVIHAIQKEYGLNRINAELIEETADILEDDDTDYIRESQFLAELCAKVINNSK